MPAIEVITEVERAAEEFGSAFPLSQDRPYIRLGPKTDAKEVQQVGKRTGAELFQEP